MEKYDIQAPTYSLRGSLAKFGLNCNAPARNVFLAPTKCRELIVGGYYLVRVSDGMCFTKANVDKHFPA
ncbi:MAG: hypothetical protein ACRCX2_27715 [Paraclostridium sp.]